jgi:serine/threonine protein kinase
MISDFGVAGWLPNGNQDRTEGERRTFVGTPCWMAPEVMEQTQPYDVDFESSDGSESLASPRAPRRAAAT